MQVKFQNEYMDFINFKKGFGVVAFSQFLVLSIFKIKHLGF